MGGRIPREVSMKTASFDELYRDVPQAQKSQLQAFRSRHQLKPIETGGIEWSYLSCGTGTRSLLFLAGAFLPFDMWFYMIDEFEARYRVLAPDSNILAGLSAREALDALPRLMDQEQVETATVIGLSAGGGMAQMMLQEHADRVEDLILSHTGILESDPVTERRLERSIRLVRVLPNRLVRRVIQKRTGGEPPASSPWLQFHEAYFREQRSAINKRIVAEFLRNGLQLRREYRHEPEAYASWNGRILILGSEDDPVTTNGLEKLKSRFPQAAVRLLPEGGHHTFMLYPEEYAAALTGFLNPSQISRK
jgi:pimeloyl-ACP methyl ester carboxylesterase